MARRRLSRLSLGLWLLAVTAAAGVWAAADQLDNPDGRADGEPHDDPDMCIQGCQLALGTPTFADLPDGVGFGVHECHSRLLTTSLFLCFRVHCYGHHEGGKLAKVNETCIARGPAPLPPYERVMANYTDAEVAQLRRLQRAEALPSTRLEEVVVPSRELFEVAYDTLDYWAYVRRYHGFYSGMMLYYWFFLIILGIGGNFWSFVTRFVRRIRRSWGSGYQPLGNDVRDLSGDETAAVKGIARRISRPRMWLKRYLTVPAAFGRRCSQDFGWYTVPPRIQSLAIFVYVILNVVACVHGYKTFEGNIYYPVVKHQMYRYVSDRTGFVSYVNFPLIWLFGMRNNLLMGLTGWDFGTFNNFHRWVARAATVQAIIHSVGYTLLVCRFNGWAAFFEWWAMFFWWTGGVATISMSLLLGFSFYWFRRHTYEFFLIVHIVLSVFVLLGMLGHVSIFAAHASTLMYFCAFIWVADRVLRALRILAFNPLFWNTRAKATYDPKANIIRLVVPYASSFYQPKPGTYYYIHVLNDKRFWESHPFTVATVASRHRKRLSQSYVELSDQVDTDATSGTMSPVKTAHNDNPDASEVSVLLSSDSASSSVYSPHTRPPSTADGDGIPSSPAHAASAMTFLIRPYDSFTARLRDMAAAGGTWPHPTSLRVLVDGPYGHSQHFDNFAKVLFLVGGSGIVVPLSHLSGQAASATATAPRHSVHIVWAVREAVFAADVLREDFREVLETGAVALDIYVTQPQEADENEADTDGSEETCGGDAADDTANGPVQSSTASSLHSRRKVAQLFGSPLPKDVRVFHERPDARGEVECAAKAAGGGRVAVVACGPGRMSDEARSTVVSLLGTRGTGDVEYFEESFQW